MTAAPLNPYERPPHQTPPGEQAMTNLGHPLAPTSPAQWTQPPLVRPTSGVAVASMVFGIIGALGGFLVCGVPCLLAVVLGHAAWKDTKSGVRGGHGMAVAGLILGYLFVIPAAIILLPGAFGMLFQ